MELKAPSRKLSKLERAWYNEYLSMGCVDATQALRNIYNKKKKPINPTTISQIAFQVKRAALSKLQLTEDDLLKSRGLDRESLDSKLAALTKAKKEIVVGMSKEGKPIVIKINDNQTQVKAIELGYKLGKTFDKADEDNTDRKVEIIIKDERKVYDVEEAEIVEVEEDADRTADKELPCPR